MRVSQSGNNPIQDSQAAKANATQGAKKADKAGSAASAKASEGVVATDGAKAEISFKVKELAKAKDVAASAPDIREQKIAELKRKIEAGKYKVDAEAVADKMVDEHLRTSQIG